MKTYDQETEQMYETIIRLLQTREEVNIRLAVQTAVGTNNAMFFDRFNAILSGFGKKEVRGVQGFLHYINDAKEFTNLMLELPNNDIRVFDFRLLPRLSYLSIGIDYPDSLPILPDKLNKLRIYNCNGKPLSSKLISNMLRGVSNVIHLRIKDTQPLEDCALDLRCALGVDLYSHDGLSNSIFESQVLFKGGYHDIEIQKIEIKPFLDYLDTRYYDDDYNKMLDRIAHNKVWFNEHESDTTPPYPLIHCKEYIDWHEKRSR